ncbi:sarcosine oxidase subunit gamma [Parahaliea mediterranea]|uniref:Sarcosine oxidase subunit gamma n=1 Tax=Parahaliea mediterranea TaxID=651086 RepID=A0A939DC14_9GAMM|nr:sarcosine oxidase subunit gamma family protein [Parahaliea mediterranea]MBN7795295.1 hypothetical protein [Parahaliea mediterranea]
MAKLDRATPLAGTGLERAGLCVAENTGLGLIRLQAFHRRPGAVEELTARLGIEPPGPGSLRSERDRQWFWSAPGEWLIAIPAGTEDAVLGALRAQLDGLFVVLSAITDSQVALDITGEAVREVLARGSTVDFHPASFGAGNCVLTRFAGVPVMLASPGRGEQILLFADRSLARYLLDWFEAASIDC